MLLTSTNDSLLTSQDTFSLVTASSLSFLYPSLALVQWEPCTGYKPKVKLPSVNMRPWEISIVKGFFKKNYSLYYKELHRNPHSGGHFMAKRHWGGVKMGVGTAAFLPPSPLIYLLTISCKFFEITLITSYRFETKEQEQIRAINIYYKYNIY